MKQSALLLLFCLPILIHADLIDLKTMEEISQPSKKPPSDNYDYTSGQRLIRRTVGSVFLLTGGACGGAAYACKKVAMNEQTTLPLAIALGSCGIITSLASAWLCCVGGLMLSPLGKVILEDAHPEERMIQDFEEKRAQRALHDEAVAKARLEEQQKQEAKEAQLREDLYALGSQ